jgi:hypothetical protein
VEGKASRVIEMVEEADNVKTMVLDLFTPDRRCSLRTANGQRDHCDAFIEGRAS